MSGPPRAATTYYYESGATGGRDYYYAAAAMQVTAKKRSRSCSGLVIHEMAACCSVGCMRRCSMKKCLTASTVVDASLPGGSGLCPLGWHTVRCSAAPSLSTAAQRRAKTWDVGLKGSMSP